jgi:hypothetical protein
MSKSNSSIVLIGILAVAALPIGGCAGTPPPPPVEPEKKEAAPEKKHSAVAMEYDLGSIDPSVAKAKFNALKSTWNDCFTAARKKNETLSGKLTLTIRTLKDGTVKWAYVTQTDLGDRSVEKCVIDSVKSTNFGAPMDAKEGEIKSYSYGWELDEDDRPADPGVASSVLPSIEKAKKKLDECKSKASAKGTVSATIYVKPKSGKPASIGVAIDDPSADGAIDCIVEVLSKLTYSNKSSWTIKSTVQLP